MDEHELQISRIFLVVCNKFTVRKFELAFVELVACKLGTLIITHLHTQIVSMMYHQLKIVRLCWSLRFLCNLWEGEIVQLTNQNGDQTESSKIDCFSRYGPTQNRQKDAKKAKNAFVNVSSSSLKMEGS